MRTHRLTAFSLLMSLAVVALAAGVAGAGPAPRTGSINLASNSYVSHPFPGHAGTGIHSRYLLLSANESESAKPASGPPLELYAYLTNLVKAEQTAWFAGLALAQQIQATHQASRVYARRSGGASSGNGGSGGGAGGRWAAIRQCESGGNYFTNTGNGYYGAYQFSQSTWQGLGYSGLPSNAPPAVQDQAAQQLQSRSGWGQWPVCGSR